MPQPRFASVTGELGEDLAAVRADLARLSELVVDLARRQAGTVRDGWKGNPEDGRPHENVGHGRRRTGLRATVVRDPLPSLLLGLAGGFALGMLKRR